MHLLRIAQESDMKSFPSRLYEVFTHDYYFQRQDK